MQHGRVRQHAVHDYSIFLEFVACTAMRRRLFHHQYGTAIENDRVEPRVTEKMRARSHGWFVILVGGHQAGRITWQKRGARFLVGEHKCCDVAGISRSTHTIPVERLMTPILLRDQSLLGQQVVISDTQLLSAQLHLLAPSLRQQCVAIQAGQQPLTHVARYADMLQCGWRGSDENTQLECELDGQSSWLEDCESERAETLHAIVDQINKRLVCHCAVDKI